MHRPKLKPPGELSLFDQFAGTQLRPYDRHVNQTAEFAPPCGRTLIHSRNHIDCQVRSTWCRSWFRTRRSPAGRSRFRRRLSSTCNRFADSRTSSARSNRSSRMKRTRSSPSCPNCARRVLRHRHRAAQTGARLPGSRSASRPRRTLFQSARSTPRLLEQWPSVLSEHGVLVVAIHLPKRARAWRVARARHILEAGHNASPPQAADPASLRCLPTGTCVTEPHKRSSEAAPPGAPSSRALPGPTRRTRGRSARSHCRRRPLSASLRCLPAGANAPHKRSSKQMISLHFTPQGAVAERLLDLPHQRAAQGPSERASATPAEPDSLRCLPAGTCVTEPHKRSSKHISLHVPPQGAVADLPSL